MTLTRLELMHALQWLGAIALIDVRSWRFRRIVIDLTGTGVQWADKYRRGLIA